MNKLNLKEKKSHKYYLWIDKKLDKARKNVEISFHYCCDISPQRFLDLSTEL